MWYLSYLHLNTWLQPIINCVSKKCSPVKSGTQILSLGLFTKSPISNQTKAIVPKAVIWSSSVIWICKLMWIENQNKPGIYPKGGDVLSDARKEGQPECWRGERKLDPGKASCFWQSFFFCQMGLVPFPINSPCLISKLLSEWDEWSRKTFRNCEKWPMYWCKREAKRFTFPRI